MKTYKINFVGRRKGAIGIMSHFEEILKFPKIKSHFDCENLILKLYDKYDHVTRVTITDQDTHEIHKLVTQF